MGTSLEQLEEVYANPTIHYSLSLSPSHSLCRLERRKRAEFGNSFSASLNQSHRKRHRQHPTNCIKRTASNELSSNVRWGLIALTCAIGCATFGRTDFHFCSIVGESAGVFLNLKFKMVIRKRFALQQEPLRGYYSRKTDGKLMEKLNMNLILARLLIAPLIADGVRRRHYAVC